MTFVPPSSVASGSISGTVALDAATLAALENISVDNFPASVAVTGPLTLAQLIAAEPLAVVGPLTDAQLAARLPLGVTGPLTDAQLAARLPLGVTGPLTDAQLRAANVDVDVSNFPASVAVTGPLTDAELRASAVDVDVQNPSLPVTGPLTDAELRASAVTVDGSGVTQPVSVDELPLPEGAATEATVSDIALTAILQRDKMTLQ